MVWALAVTEENQYKASLFHSLVNVVILAMWTGGKANYSEDGPQCTLEQK